jgi:glycosyltransferase involved in cell wall biosynthesis
LKAIEPISLVSAPTSVLHFIPGLHYRDGGPSHSVVRLTDALAADPNLSVTLVSHSDPTLESIPSSNALVHRETALSSNQAALVSGLVDRGLVKDALARQCVDLLHIHSIWHLSNHWAMRLAERHWIPLICHPRGMLEPWSLLYRGWKKRLALSLFHRADLERTRGFIATSIMESESIRRMGLRQPVAIIPNGVDFPVTAPGANEARAAGGERIVLFLSRIHPKKGVLVLLKAWAQCAAPGWRLVLAGPDEGGHLREVMRDVAALGIADKVTYVGEVRGAGKEAAYRSANLFVLPSFGENFGLVIAEALAYGVPVITTRHTPWSHLETDGCGWWIDAGVEPLVDALRRAMALPDDTRREMGRRGQEHVARYQWSNTARQTAAFYDWILGQGERPDFVIHD